MVLLRVAQLDDRLAGLLSEFPDNPLRMGGYRVED